MAGWEPEEEAAVRQVLMARGHYEALEASRGEDLAAIPSYTVLFN